MEIILMEISFNLKARINDQNGANATKDVELMDPLK